MHTDQKIFDEAVVLHHLRHYLPAQAPLKDFVHHNTLHAFDNFSFFEALQKANSTFGYKTALSLKEYRKLFQEGVVKEEVLNTTILNFKEDNSLAYWKSLVLNQDLSNDSIPQIGLLKAFWKSHF